MPIPAWLTAKAAIIGGAFIALLLLLGIQTARIEGFKVWPIKVTGYKAKLAAATAELKRIDEEAQKAKARGEALAKELRSKTDEANRVIIRDAGVIRVSGPGKARCPAISAGAGGSEAQPGEPNAARSAMPSDDRAAVPWGWLVGRAESCDLNRQEALTWREWYDRLKADWPK